MKNEITYIDLFAGIGGFRLGLEKANDTITERTQQGIQQGSENNPTTIKSFLGTKQFTCVWSNEWDKYCATIYEKNFGEKPDTRDIRTVPSREIPDHDLLCAGFPCPTFSIAGKGKGFEDTRGAVFFEIPRILRDKRPRHLLLENVKGLLSHQAGQTFQTILGVLSGLGCRCEWQVLNSKNFGVPQNRERVFIVGHLGGGGGSQVFPIGEMAEENPKKVIRRQFDMSGKGYNSQQDRLYSKDGVMGCLPNANPDNKILLDLPKIRRLTPIECERLQGFPDNWTEGVSDTQRYKMLGNAVTVNVIEAIGRKLNCLKG